MREEGPIDREAIETGSIPWDKKELFEAIDHFHHLIAMPHDDWNRRREEVTIVDEGGHPVESIRMNPDHIDNQLIGFIRDRSRAAGHDRTTTMSHMWRFMEVQYFIREHFQQLVDDSLIRHSEGDSEAVEISEHLLRELAIAPYEGAKANPTTREAERTFDYKAVVLRAKARDA